VRLRIFSAISLFAVTCSAAPPALPLMPWPQKVAQAEGSMRIDVGFHVEFAGYQNVLLQRAAERLKRNLERQTTIAFAGNSGAALRIFCAGADAAYLTEEAAESYTLEVTPQGAEVRAGGPAGVLRGMATFLQLAQSGRTPAIHIEDHPRFAWRGLLIDVSRHFMTMETLRRQIDAMEAVKLNVLHLHLSDAQGFRVESKVYPKLQGMGSDGMFYTQEEIRGLVEYAGDRGIRLVPEFDVPGHSKSWLIGYPELASKALPYRLGKDGNNGSAVLDPSREEVYVFLDKLFGEMAQLFPDRYFHIGGDEVNPAHWTQNPAIQAFIRDKWLKDTQELEAYFAQRVAAILARHGKRMMGWDELLRGTLPKDVMIEAWRSSKMQGRSVRQGYRTIVATGYYLDWVLPAGFHYAIDPADTAAFGLTAEQLKRVKGTYLEKIYPEEYALAGGTPMTPEEESRILGGEAAMWSEMVTDEMLDGRIWPRIAAIAERFWSARTVRDEEQMYERLAAVDTMLDAIGIRQRSNPRNMLARVSPEAVTLGETVEPIRYYARFKLYNKGVMTPLADAVPAESLTAWRFGQDVSQMLGGDGSRVPKVRMKLEQWRNSAAREPALPISADIGALTSAGLEALTAWERKSKLPAEKSALFATLIERQRRFAAASADPVASQLDPQPPDQVLIAITGAIEELLKSAR
jgi:hexosaminidase